MREFRAIRDDWEQAVLGQPQVQFAFSLKQNAAPLAGDERAAAIERLASRCLELAERHPESVGALAALYLAATRGNESTFAGSAVDRIICCIESSDLDGLSEAIREARVHSASIDPTVISAILRRTERSPNHPRAAELVTRACVMALDNGTPTSEFSAAANIIKRRYASSPDIVNYCEIMGNGTGSPRWTGEYEQHLREITHVNRNRHVRCAAMFALASVIQAFGEARQTEAAELYRRCVDEFDGQFEYPYQAIEQRLHESAKAQLDELKHRAIGHIAPEVIGVDLDDVQMRLSDYRGRVALLSFWASWCRPCVEFIPHEKALANRFRTRPFAIVGVNGDTDQSAAMKAVSDHEITWRSFKDRVGERAAISQDWKLLGWPTFYLIDHEGIIRQKWVDVPHNDELNAAIEQLVRAVPQAKPRSSTQNERE